MFTVALLGADGAGKSTIIRRLKGNLPFPVKFIYMGENINSSNVVLPTTLLWHKIKQFSGRDVDSGGPPDTNKIKLFPKNPVKRIAIEFKSAFRMINLMAEEWFRQFVAWFYLFQGYVVVFDRHFFLDYYKHHILESNHDQTIANRLHGMMLNRVFPKPDLVVCLDAPAEVLFSRKKEGTIELLDQRRQEYLDAKHLVENFMVVNVMQTESEVTKLVSDLILDFYYKKTGAIKAGLKKQGE